MEVSDQDLVARVQSGDGDAFRTLVERYSRSVFRLAFRMTDEELKVYALNSLLHSAPDRALPLLEKILTSTASPQLKERALFVLTQIKGAEGQPSPARPILLRIAQGGANPDLQRKAVDYLGQIADRDSSILQTLSQIKTKEAQDYLVELLNK
ncbi:MAG: hypothetical protein FJW20_22780 [Acidimicrobiia bacterium]|nr:hypothetical protein [Acidimicrobiia bacterium]